MRVAISRFLFHYTFSNNIHVPANTGYIVMKIYLWLLISYKPNDLDQTPQNEATGKVFTV